MKDNITTLHCRFFKMLMWREDRYCCRILYVRSKRDNFTREQYSCGGKLAVWDSVLTDQA